MDVPPDNKSARDIKVTNVISLTKAAREAADAEKTKEPVETVETDANATLELASQHTDLMPVSSSSLGVVHDHFEHEIRRFKEHYFSLPIIGGYPI